MLFFQKPATFPLESNVIPTKIKNLNIHRAMNHELAQILEPISILGTLSLGFYLITKVFTEYFLRKKMVDKGLIGTEASELLRKQQSNDKYSALKWGLITLFGGIGLILLEVIPYDENSPLPFGILATSLSLGFLLYFIVVRRISNN